MAKVSKVKMTIEIEYDVTDPKAAPGSTTRIPGQIRNIITERIGTSPTHIDPDSVKVTVTKKSIDRRVAYAPNGRPVKTRNRFGIFKIGPEDQSPGLAGVKQANRLFL